MGGLASEEIEQASLDPPRSEIPRGTTVLALPTSAPWTDLNPKPDLRSTTGIRPLLPLRIGPTNGGEVRENRTSAEGEPPPLNSDPLPASGRGDPSAHSQMR